MKQEYKKLLLRDLCVRLPYGLKVLCIGDSNHKWYNLEMLDIKDNEVYLTTVEPYTNRYEEIENVKPYLFPISSMTEDQKMEYNRRKHEVPVCHYEYGDAVEEIELYDSPYSFEYLIENHFDAYDLIPRGLAIDATGLGIY